MMTRMFIKDEDALKHTTTVVATDYRAYYFTWWCKCGEGDNSPTGYPKASKAALEHREDMKVRFFAKKIIAK